MSDKRYQVFISSTLKDLAGHRQKAIYELQTSGFIAVGMEQFSATDEEQFEHIKKEILLSDYYVVITRGRYGTKASDGKSYTEKEYDFAVEQGIPVLAFIYDETARQKLPESDKDPENHKEFMAFIQKLQTGRIVKIWSDPEKLISDIIVSVFKQTHSKPRIGWVRGDAVMTSKAMNELEGLRSENAEMKAKLAESNEDWKKYLEVKLKVDYKVYSKIEIECNDDFDIDTIHENQYVAGNFIEEKSIQIAANDFFIYLGKKIIDEPSVDFMNILFYRFVSLIVNADNNVIEFQTYIPESFMQHIIAAKLITTKRNNTQTVYQLTDRGRDYYAKSVALLPDNETTL